MVRTHRQKNLNHAYILTNLNTQLEGTKFLPLVVDAHGNSGGVQNTIFSVTGMYISSFDCNYVPLDD